MFLNSLEEYFLGFSQIGITINLKYLIRVNRYLIATASTIIVEAALVISIIGFYQESYYLCYISAALWGAADCVI